MTLMLAVAPVAGVALLPPDDDWLAPPPADELALDDVAAVFFDELHALIPRTATPTRTPARTHIGRDTENSLFAGMEETAGVRSGRWNRCPTDRGH
jgi:hypothetical protein